ncbi:hypothetical protein ACFL5O_10865, partial [Myxococcota bacterium]
MQVATHRSRLELASSYQVQVGFPAGFDPSTVALYATESLRVADGVVVQNDSAVLAPVVSVGAGKVELGADGRAGSVISGGQLRLGSRVRVEGNAQAAAAIEKQDGVTITGSELGNTPLGSLSNLSFSVEFPPSSGDWRLEPDQTGALEPGAYSEVVIKSRSVAQLRAGKYYTDRLQMEPQATLELDTSAGAVILYVREALDFKGSIQNSAQEGGLFLAYLGGGTLSLESAFNGTIVAPSATLRLGPVGSPGHRGSFFAQTIEAAEARSTITHVPFGFWFEVLDVHPVLQCVRRYKEPYGAALFGYRNDSDFAVRVPLGASNQLVPDSGQAPPTELLPGVHPREFWAPLDLSQTVTWELAGESVVASGSSALCELGDVPAGSEPQPAPSVVPIDGPQVLFDSVADQIVPDVTTEAFSHLPAPIYGPEVGPIPGNTPNREAGPASFTFSVNSLHFDDSEGLCGTVDPFVNQLTIDGQDFGKRNSGTLQVARDRRTLRVTIDVNDDDDFLCLGDEHLEYYSVDVDLYTGAANTCIDGGRLCYTATPIASPEICFNWNAQFLDAGPWPAPTPTEDFLGGKGVQVVPASFARYNIKMVNQNGVLHDRGGTLDAQGCVPGPDLPIREDWELGKNLTVALELRTQLCLDPAGTNCQDTPNPTGAGVLVHQDQETGPANLCSVLAENPASVADPNCTVRAIDWTGLPPTKIEPAFQEENTVTRATAVLSHIFRRDAETDGGLGIELAMIERRRTDSNGHLEVVVDRYCEAADPCTNELRLTSCKTGGANGKHRLEIEPEGLLASMTRFKYVMAHEFGHYLQDAGQGLPAKNYGCGAGNPNEPPVCRCDHVPRDQQLHCLQSLEEPNAAQMEGFAYYFAAKAMNADVEPDCTFVYAKPFADTACKPGAASCAQDPETGLWVSEPPVPLSCKEAVRWRNTHCINANSSPDVLSRGTEYDWMEFFYAIN